MDPVSRSRGLSSGASLSCEDERAPSRGAAPPPRRLAPEPERLARLPSASRDLGALFGAGASPAPLGRSAVARASVEGVALDAGRARDAAVRARLDAFRAASSGPYRVDGASVEAPPMFRMSGGANDAAAARSHVPGGSRYGRPQTAGELVAATQKLIDQGKLRGIDGPDVASRIRTLQWREGLGIDCAGYTQLAVVAATGSSRRALGLHEAAGFERLSALGRRAGWEPVASPASLRPGDVVELGSPHGSAAAGDQHRVVVYDRRVVTTAGDAAALARALGPAMGARLAHLAGPVHVVEVDSSWGAGAFGAPDGGVRRATWAFDEASGTWFSRHGADGDPAAPLEVSSAGPYGHALDGMARARAVKP